MDSKPKYFFRPPTIPLPKNRIGYRDRQGRNEVNLEKFELISRPNQHFFKLFFQRDKYLWVVFHKDIRNSSNVDIAGLYNQAIRAFESMNAKDLDLPICTDLQSFQKWTQQYQCKVAVHQSVNQEDLFKVLENENTVMVKLVVEKNTEIIKKIRKSKYNYKVRCIDDNFKEIIQEIKQDMERVKIQTNTDKLQKVRLPNFMKLKSKDKAELIRYRNNIYCLINLHKNKTDIQASKKMFISQSEKMYTSQKEKAFIQYYKTYPSNDEEILKFYTEDSFFYKSLNNTLRIAKSPEEFFIIGDPLNKMFHAIKNFYHEQFPYSESRKNMKLYRGADLSPTQTEYLESCIGAFIQIHGFVSSTQDIEIAKKFARQRGHNIIIEFIFDEINLQNKKILENDYGFVNLQKMSKFQEKQILFNVLNIFKVVGKEKRGEFQIYTLKYGTIFNILDSPNPENLPKQDRMAYYTYRQLMGQKENLQDLGQIFLKTNETQKSVDYYEAKITEARGQNKQEQVNLTIKKCQALIQNGQPSRALQTIALLMNENKRVVRTTGGMKFLQSVLNNKEEIIQQIDITKHFSEASQNEDKFDQAQTQISETSEALQDALNKGDRWDFDVAFGQLKLKIQLAQLKQSMQSFNQASTALKQAQNLANSIIEKIVEKQVSFHDEKKLYFQKTRIYQLMAKISSALEGQHSIDTTELEKKYDETEKILLQFIQNKSYDKSLIEIRKAEILRHRKDFNQNKNFVIQLVINSLFDIKETSMRDSEVPKTYHMLAEMEKSTHTIASTQSAITYFEREYCINTQYYSEYDPKSIKTVIDIAQCQRELKNSNVSLDLMKQQVDVKPYQTKQKHTVVTKVLYMMGMAYLDLGDFNLALKAFDKAIIMLREILSSNQFEKYHHRFKIQLQLGRTMTFLLRYNQAEDYLKSYYSFTIRIHQSQHTQIANALNHFGILYMKWKKYTQSRQKFQQSEKMFKSTSGEKSLVCAKINCNLGMIYCFFDQKNKALQCIDRARSLFDFIYLQQTKDSDPVHRQSYMIEYYYGDIYKKFRDYKQAIASYYKSIDKLGAFRAKEKRVREEASIGIMSVFKPSFIQRTDQHELICKVKIIECQVKLKDYSFGNKLGKVISELERQLQDYNVKSDKTVGGQLVKLLDFCKKIQASLKQKESKVNPSLVKPIDEELGDLHIEPRQIKND